MATAVLGRQSTHRRPHPAATRPSPTRTAGHTINHPPMAPPPRPPPLDQPGQPRRSTRRRRRCPRPGRRRAGLDGHHRRGGPAPDRQHPAAHDRAAHDDHLTPTGMWSDRRQRSDAAAEQRFTVGTGPPVMCRPKRFSHGRKASLASGLCSTQSSRTGVGHEPVRAMAVVELVHEDGEHLPALHRIGDARGRRRQVGHNAVLEMERELRPGSEVGQPVPSLRCRYSAQVDVVAQAVEDDLNAPAALWKRSADEVPPLGSAATGPQGGRRPQPSESM